MRLTVVQEDEHGATSAHIDFPLGEGQMIAPQLVTVYGDALLEVLIGGMEGGGDGPRMPAMPKYPINN